MRKCIMILVAMIGCTPVTTERFGYPPQSPPYTLGLMQTTPSGIEFDSTGQRISGELIDRLVHEVETCVGKSIDRKSFVVKIPNDWGLSCDKSQQVLESSPAPGAGCDAKGLHNSCPCLWRARLQWGKPMVIVTTPSLYLFKDPLTRLATDIANPWSDPSTSKCVQPTTEPLSTGQ